MLKARANADQIVRCPTCDKTDYIVFRRRPVGGGRIENLCRCEICDETFSFEEDKAGRMALSS